MNRYIIFGFIIACIQSMHSMEDTHYETWKSKIEQSQDYYLKTFGKDDAPKEVLERLKEVQKQFISKGLLDPKSVILIKQMNTNAIETLKKNKSVDWNNCFNNLDNIIHIDPRHSIFTKEESSFFLAHEVAHIAIVQNDRINPHCWIDKPHVWVNTIAICGVVPGLGFAMLESMARSNSKPIQLWGLTFGTLFGLAYYLDKSLYTVKPGVERYKFLNKTEEAWCDILAATTLPHGAKGGISLYQKFLDTVGDTSGVNNSHPKTSTRITYLKFIDWWQDRKQQ